MIATSYASSHRPGRRRRASSVVIGLAAAGLFAVGCASDSPDAGGTASSGPAGSVASPSESSTVTETFPANGDSVVVQAIDNSFRPEPVEIVAGTEVVFENRGRNDHNVLPADDPEASSWGVQKDAFAPGDTYAYVFGAPGTYSYYCSIHGTAEVGMVGTIVVTAP